jgi:RNA polymerase sigma-70 factor, ECF subfamily
MDTTNISLLERLKLPVDQRAWSRFVDLYTPMIYSWSRQVGLQESDAADLVKEVFASLVQKMGEFAYDSRKSFRAWLRTVTLNKWRERCRRQAARPNEVTGNAGLEVADSAEASFGELEYRQQLVARALELMRAEFQPTTWKACWEMVVTGRSAAEVGAELGLSPGAAYAAKFRVLDRLRGELAEMLE